MKMLRRNNSGAALVEFAIAALLLITLVMGIIDFGVIVMSHTALDGAAREGARWVALGGDSVDGLTSTVQQSAQTLNNWQQITVQPQYRVQTAAGTWPTWSDGIPGANVLATGNVQVKVTATYNCDRPSGSLFGTNPITIRGEAVYRRE